jgi:protein-tyrosine-phosphatase
MSADRRRPLPQAMLFACSQNVIRSPMAAALMRLRHGKRVWVESCGAQKADAVDPFAVAVMAEVGVDLRKHYPKSFDDLDDASFDLIVTLSPEAHHRAHQYVRYLSIDVDYWPTLDPSLAAGSRDQRLEEYRVVRDMLDRKIATAFEL